VQRKQFRIEQMMSSRRGMAPALEPDVDAVTSLRRNLASLVTDEHGRRLPRAAAELGAAVESMEKSAQLVLAAAEAIDDGVRAMSSTHAASPGYEMAPEIQQRIAQIYEACNFQDLAGQRIGKVIALLGHFDEQLAHVLAGGGHVAPAIAKRDDGLINGPRLDGAAGHVDQGDVDLLFD
jgi:chemotaxis protein CheZ